MGVQSELAACAGPVLVDAVKFVQRSQLLNAQAAWKSYVQAMPAKERHMDPSRHSSTTLAAFLASLLAGSRAQEEPAAQEQRRLFKRYLRWRRLIAQEEAELHQLTAEHGWAQNYEGPVWDLVRRTQSHPDYKRKYSFPSYGKGWTRISRLPPKHQPGVPVPPTAARLLGLDCEMCVTTRDPKALLSLCVVDQIGMPVIGGLAGRGLVKPRGGAVQDLKTALTGVTSDRLVGVTQRRGDILRRLLPLLEGGRTILVGHSLHQDLAALRLDYEPVIDTAMLFSYSGLSKCTPSLVDLSRLVLKKTIRGEHGDGVHNSQEDATTSLALVAHEIEHGPTPPMPPPAFKAAPTEICKLLVHNIPSNTSEESIAATFAAAGVSYQSMEGDVGSGRTLLVFRHAGLANEAFAALPGQLSRDAMGRASKRVPLQSTSSSTSNSSGAGKSGGVIVVRKMAAHNGAVFGKDARPDRVKRAPLQKERKGKRKGQEREAQQQESKQQEEQGKQKRQKGQPQQQEQQQNEPK